MKRFLPVLLLAACTAHADPIAVSTSAEGATVTLYSSRCELPGVSNLKQRATWDDKGKRYEGCFTVQHGIVIMYWDDRSIVIAGQGAFVRAAGL